MKTRGQIETPVVLVFAVVAGILVLLLVGWFVLRQQTNVSHQQLLTSLKGIDVAIGTAESTQNAAQDVQTIDDLRYVCDDTGPALWYGTDATRSLKGGVVFGSPHMGGTVTIRSAPLGGAYRVANVVYLISAQDKLSAGIDLPIPITNGPYTHTTSAGSTTLRVADTNPGYGTVEFTPGGTYAYVGPALLAGALVSADVHVYACGLTLALARYRFANRLQWQRMQKMKEAYGVESPCADLYNDESAFSKIEKALSTGSANDGTKTADDFRIGDAQAIAEAERQIAQMNDNLVRASCATVS